jgi:hypothetical protein
MNPGFRMDSSGKLIYTRKHHILSKPLYSFQTIADPFSGSIIHYVCSVVFLLLSLLIVFIFELLNRSRGNVDFLTLPHDFVSENVLSLIRAQLHPKRTLLLFTIILQQEHEGLSQASMSTRPSLCCDECWQHLRLLFVL